MPGMIRGFVQLPCDGSCRVSVSLGVKTRENGARIEVYKIIHVVERVNRQKYFLLPYYTSHRGTYGNPKVGESRQVS